MTGRFEAGPADDQQVNGGRKIVDAADRAEAAIKTVKMTLGVSRIRLRPNPSADLRGHFKLSTGLNDFRFHPVRESINCNFLRGDFSALNSPRQQASGSLRQPHIERRILTTIDQRLREQLWTRQPRVHEMLDQASGGIPPPRSMPKSRVQHFRHLLPRGHGWATMISLVKADFMECDHSAGFQMARSGSNEGAGVGLMHQHISTNDDVELFPNRILVNRANFEINVLKAAGPSPLVGGSDRPGIAINPDHGARRPDSFGSQQRNITDAAAKVEHAHPLAKLHASQKPLGDRPQNRRLKLQPVEFGRQILKHIRRSGQLDLLHDG
jgi:hypothetical protein